MAAQKSREDQNIMPVRRWLLLLTVQLVTLLFGMAITASTIVLPHIRGALSVNQDQASWTVTLFLVGAAVGTPITGWLAGRLGWRRLMIGTLIGFTIASVACGLSTNIETLLISRTAQGLFGAPLTPLGLGMLLATFPKRQHALVLMLWGVGGTMGIVLGPILGGVVGEVLGWRWTYLFLAPISVIAIIIAAFALGDQQRGTSGRFGWIGFLSLAIAMGSAQLLLDRGHRLDWFESFEISIELFTCLTAILIFVGSTVYSRTPFFERAIFTNWNFAVGLVTILLMGALSYSPIALFPTLLQDLRGYPDATAGLLLSARGLGNLASLLIVVQFTRKNAKLALTTGIAMQIWAGWGMYSLNINMTEFDVMWTNFLQGFGFGLAYTPMAVLAFATMPNQLTVQAAALFNVIRNFGSSLFLSICMLVLLRSTAENYAGLSQAINPMNQWLSEPQISSHWGTESMESIARLSQEITHQSLMGGYLNAFGLFTLVAVAALPLAWLYRSDKYRNE
ncbi:MAG: DHA2 family efflux MFS transporter permease subunit [Proteobacteria bacterium]|nr:DHA2 family efflux MFS transporter permease subunit [Pseudomonadota bacterium]MDA1331963.1 DHA2 family efflux MFS transporter permease subunit [Pseudomonadota bacterium]